MYVISFDVATKSLAVSIIKYNVFLNEELKKSYEKYLSRRDTSNVEILIKQYNELLCEVNRLLDTEIEILYMDVVDLIPGKKLKDTSIIERTKSLASYLRDFDKIVTETTESPVVLIEYQMGPNDKSRAVSSQIMYHFADYTVYLVGPSLKNTLIVNEENYSEFAEKYRSNYLANKNHSKCNFLKIIKHLKKEEMIKNIKKKNIDDIADSVLMSIAWFKTNHRFHPV